jgi:hypothetical protein
MLALVRPTAPPAQPAMSADQNQGDILIRHVHR